MGLQKEREAFEAWISEVCPHVKMDLNAKTECEYDSSSMSLAWYAWQAAKASAVPDGYVVVPINYECAWCGCTELGGFSDETMIEAVQEPAND